MLDCRKFMFIKYYNKMHDVDIEDSFKLNIQNEML